MLSVFKGKVVIRLQKKILVNSKRKITEEWVWWWVGMSYSCPQIYLYDVICKRDQTCCSVWNHRKRQIIINTLLTLSLVQIQIVCFKKQEFPKSLIRYSTIAWWTYRVCQKNLSIKECCSNMIVSVPSNPKCPWIYSEILCIN